MFQDHRKQLKIEATLDPNKIPALPGEYVRVVAYCRVTELHQVPGEAILHLCSSGEFLIEKHDPLTETHNV